MAYADRGLRRRVRQDPPAAVARPRPPRTGIDATIAAWTHGAAWTDGLVAYLGDRRDQLAKRLAAETPAARFHRPDSTFLAWLDASDCRLGDAPATRLLEQGAVAVSEGSEFGTNGRGHVRLNFGTSAAVLDEILDRLTPCLRP